MPPADADRERKAGDQLCSDFVITNSDRPGYPLFIASRARPPLLLTSNLGQKSFEPPGRTPPAGGGWRCVDVPLSGYTARLNSDREQAAWVLDILEANRRLAQ